MYAYTPSGAQVPPITTGPGVPDGDGVNAGTSGTGGTMVVATTIDGAGSGATVVAGGEDGRGARDVAVAGPALRAEVARRAGVGVAAEVLGGAGRAAYRLVFAGRGVTGGAASWSTARSEPPARPRVSHPISPTSSA